MPIGKAVTFRTKEWHLPSLSLDEVIQFQDDGTLAKVPAKGGGTIADRAMLEALVVVVTAALKHNYPELTQADVRAELDLENTERVVQALMGVSRLETPGKPEGEAAPQTR